MHATDKTITSISKSLKVAFIDAKFFLSHISLAFQFIESYSVVFGSFRSIRSYLVLFVHSGLSNPLWSILSYSINFGPIRFTSVHSIHFSHIRSSQSTLVLFCSNQSTLVSFGPFCTHCFYSIHLSPF